MMARRGRSSRTTDFPPEAATLKIIQACRIASQSRDRDISTRLLADLSFSPSSGFRFSFRPTNRDRTIVANAKGRLRAAIHPRDFEPVANFLSSCSRKECREIKSGPGFLPIDIPATCRRGPKFNLIARPTCRVTWIAIATIFLRARLALNL